MRCPCGVQACSKVAGVNSALAPGAAVATTDGRLPSHFPNERTTSLMMRNRPSHQQITTARTTASEKAYTCH